MFFDGNKPKRNVSLRGSNKTESKKNFLDRLQDEREQRHKQKQKQKSALAIQAFWRSKKIVEQQKTALRNEWDLNIKVENVDRFTGDFLRVALRQLLFFYKSPQDDTRLDMFCSIIWNNIRLQLKTPDSQSNFCCIENEQQIPLWVFNIGKFLSLCQTRLTSRLDIYLQPFLHLTDPESVVFTFTPSQPNFKSIISGKITFKLVTKGLYQELSTLLQQFLSDPTQPVDQQKNIIVQLLITLAFRPLLFHKAGENSSTTIAVHQQFISYIFTIPYLTMRLPPNMIVPFVKLLPIILSFEPSIKNLNFSENFLIIEHERRRAMHLIGNLFGFGKHLFTTLGNTLKESKSFSLLTTYIKFTNLAFRIVLPAGESIFVEMPDNSLFLQQLRAIVDAEVVKVLLGNLLSLVPQSNKTINAIPPALIHLIGLYAELLAHWKSMQINILNVLAFSIPLTRTLWLALRDTTELLDLARNGKSEEQQDLCGMLLMFAKCYNHLLFSLDDTEFFETQAYFTLYEVKSMIQILKHFIFSMYWNHQNEVTHLELREAITLLLQNLYDRNSRHPFCQDSDWSTPELIHSELDTNDDRVQTILKFVPFLIPFPTRLKIFYSIIDNEKSEIQSDLLDSIPVRIRRDFIFEDGFNKLHSLDSKLKKRIKVEIISSSGLVEAGIDGGGVFKEFFTELIKTAYNTEYGLFRETQQRYLYPNPGSNLIVSDDLNQFEFLGKILGKAIYEHILIELPFANFFLAKLLGKFNYVNDLAFLDADLHKQLRSLKEMKNIEDLAINFTVTEKVLGKTEIIELVPGGRDLPVTNENKLRFIARLADYKLNGSIKKQSQAFLNGLSQLIAPQLLKMFNQEELQILISGRSGGIDIANMRKFTNYSGGYHDSHPVIQAFWTTLQTFTPEEQQQFLMFVTSCSRPPLLGFEYLQPRFCIHQSFPDSGSPDQYLPTASTCMNFFKLPPYSTDVQMKQKILYAITSRAGFELS